MAKQEQEQQQHDTRGVTFAAFVVLVPVVVGLLWLQQDLWSRRSRARKSE